MLNIAVRTARILRDNGVINEDEADACRYGLEIMLSSALEIVSILFIAMFVKNLLQTILFFSAFIPLRIYAGGYHAGTRMRCYLLSLVVYGVFSVILKVMQEDAAVVFIISESLFTVAAVVFFSPVVHYRKSVNSAERSRYKKISIYICFAQIIIITVCAAFMKTKTAALCLAAGQLAESLSIVAVKILSILSKSQRK